MVLELNFNLTFQELYTSNGLMVLNDIFYEQHQKYSNNSLINKAIILEKFLLSLFNIEYDFTEKNNLLKRYYEFNKTIINRYAVQFLAKNPECIDDAYKNINSIENELLALLNIKLFDIHTFIDSVFLWHKNKDEYNMKISIQYIYIKLIHDIRYEYIFKIPKKILDNGISNINSLYKSGESSYSVKEELLSDRYGFSITDEGISLEKFGFHVNYCLYCGDRGRDSCSTGIKSVDNSFKKSVYNIAMKGCPLDQKISEMNYLSSLGFFIAALAIIMIDNPMCPATGHRICNDCMNSCIYQKQESVDIPSIETYILKFVLQLPYGFEIYSLLTRWNPLVSKNVLYKNIQNDKKKKNVMVVGAGPAGFTMSHYLLNEGFYVVLIDALKIEPCEKKLKSIIPIKDILTINEDLQTRNIYGFGGVMEYGITVRWDKNFLKIIRAVLERRNNFRLIGGVRLGSNITLEQCYEYGFHHVALAIGAGKPKLPC